MKKHLRSKDTNFTILEYEKSILMYYGFHNVQFNFRIEPTWIGEIFSGQSPSRNGGDLSVVEPPKGFPVPNLPEMPNEHSPGLEI